MRIELLLFLSFIAMLVLLIACSAPRRPTPTLSPTLFPQLTLDTYNPQFVTRVGAEAAIAASVLPAKPRLPEVNISPPRCYRSLYPQLTCFGTVRNLAEDAISDINLKAIFSGADGAAQDSSIFSLEQRRIPAGEQATYRLQLPNKSLEHATLAISLEAARLSPSWEARLSFDEESAAFIREANVYHLRGMLSNIGADAAHAIRLLVTLENESGAIIGYRALDLPEFLPTGGSLPIDISITPLESATEIRHHLVAQALPPD